MDYFTLKTIIAVVFILAGLTAFVSMLILMGKQEKKISPQSLRMVHKTAGLVFFLLTLVLVFFGFRYWAKAGDLVSVRAVLHAVLALGLLVVLLIKISIARFYKQLLKYAPALGIVLFSFAFVVFCTSAGFFLARSIMGASLEKNIEQPVVSAVQGNIDAGQSLFQKKCSSCHFSDKKEKKFGPGLAGLLRESTLPSSGKPATRKNIIGQLQQPLKAMPAFPDFSDKELADLLAFLETL